MLGKKIILSVFILSLLFANLFTVKSDAAISGSDNSHQARDNEVVQFQQMLNDKGFWIGPIDGILSSKAYQAVMKYQMDTNLVADGLVGKQIRQAPSLDVTDSASDSSLVLDTNPAPLVNSAAEPPGSVNKKSDPTVSRGTSATSRANKVISMVATAYDGSYECNKPYYGSPSYTGLPLAHGIVAVDPKVIPMGTRLYVEGYGDAIAADQGSAIKGNRIDLFFDSHQQALNFGMKTVKVTILGN